MTSSKCKVLDNSYKAIVQDTPTEEQYPNKQFITIPKPFSRGSTGIAGTLVRLMLDTSLENEDEE